MLRLFMLLAGYLALVGCFVSAVIDGARSIAGGALSITTMGDVVRGQLFAIQQTVSQIHPVIWDPVVLRLMRLPLWLGLGILGMALVWLTSSTLRSRPAGLSSDQN